MKTARLGQTDLDVSVLGLGCARIASLSTRQSSREIARLLDAAYDGGIRFFDTANIYGQGDSERRLRAVAARPGTVICTKAGLRLKTSQTLVRLVKPVLRPILTRLRRPGAMAAAMRQASEDVNLDPDHLRAELEGSLRRLGRDSVDLFLLHAAPADAIGKNGLYELLDSFRASGKARWCGVSVYSIDEGRRIVADGQVDAIQVPLSAASLGEAEALLNEAHGAGVGVIAREVFGGGPAGDIRGALAPLLADSRISTSLTGTANIAHLRENIAAVEALR